MRPQVPVRQGRAAAGRTTFAKADHPDHRAAARFDTALTVDVEGRTRNISASGFYFETEVDFPIGSRLNLSVQFTHGGKQHWLPCEGKVVRVTQADGRNGVAAQLVTPFFETRQEVLVARPAARNR